MEFTASTIAGFLKGEIEGNPDIKVNTIAKIEEGCEGALSFLANPKYEHYIYETKSSIVLGPTSLPTWIKASLMPNFRYSLGDTFCLPVAFAIIFSTMVFPNF